MGCNVVCYILSTETRRNKETLILSLFLINMFNWCCYFPSFSLSLITQSELLTSIILEALTLLCCDWLDITSG